MIVTNKIIVDIFVSGFVIRLRISSQKYAFGYVWVVAYMFLFVIELDSYVTFNTFGEFCENRMNYDLSDCFIKSRIDYASHLSLGKYKILHKVDILEGFKCKEIWNIRKLPTRTIYTKFYRNLIVQRNIFSSSAKLLIFNSVKIGKTRISSSTHCPANSLDYSHWPATISQKNYYYLRS